MSEKRRLTIGVLVGFQVYEGSHPNPFVSPVVHGIQTAARDQGINLMVACGVSRGTTSQRQYFPAWPENFGSADFVPVGPWNTDGLLVFNPLRFPEQIRYIQDLKDKGFPVFFIGTGAGTPAIKVDNEGGIHQAMEHLAGHGHREIAFIAGDESDPGDTQSRLQAYRAGVQSLKLKDDPRLVEFGQHWEVGGYNAMQRLLSSGVKFSAVVCSNDESAIGVLRAIREAGLRVPWDVAVTGFDDHITAMAQVPPLTSIHYPLFETGYRALLLIRKRLEQGPEAVPEITRMSTWLVTRQSCGCLPEMAVQAAIGSDSGAEFAGQSLQQNKQALTRAMLKALLAETAQPQDEKLRLLCDQLVDDLQQSLQKGDISHFHRALIEILQHVEMTSEDNAYVWQSVISVLRQAVHDLPKDTCDASCADRAEDLLHQARTLLNESTQRGQTRLQVQQTKLDENMGLLTARLISASEEAEVHRVLQEDLPMVGVRSGRVIFFEPKGGDPIALSNIHSLEPNAPALRFETRQFPPPGLYTSESAFNLALLPFFFQNEKIGYAVFDGGNLDPLATLVRQLSSSIKNVELHAKVLELSLTDGLTDIHNRRFFEIFLQKETERSRRYDRDLAVIIADIDHFKRYNDTFGHPAGDEALREVAACLMQGARRGLDVVSRYGGEEFAIILPETNTEGALVVAESVRKQIQSDPKFLQPTTISLGIASMRGKELASNELVDLADKALYQAKLLGRNRTVHFEDWMLESAHPSGAGKKVNPRRKASKTKT